jgi:hypothetical protein
MSNPESVALGMLLCNIILTSLALYRACQAHTMLKGMQ